MDAPITSVVQNACRMLLRPIASVVMKCGMTWKEFSNLSKSVFVEIATAEYGIRGRPTNISRVSVLTGISRKEIKRQRDLLLTSEPILSSKTTDATRILSGWHQDPDFLDDSGRPIALNEQGPIPSFATLFAKYGGDAPQQSLFKELRNAKSIEVNADGKLVAKSRYHMPVAMAEGNIRFFGTNLYDHAQTLNNNVSGSEDATPRFEGFAVDDQIDAQAAAEFKEFMDQRSQLFLEEVDAWLDQHRVSDSDKKTVPIRLGAGIYAIEGALPKGKPS
jgi:hypothetical protein